MSATIQETYGKRAKGFKGGLSNSNPATTRSGVTEEVTEVGKFVKHSVTGGIVNLSGDASTSGVILRSDALQLPKVEAKTGVTVIKRGSLLVECETACIEGADVFARFTANGVLEVGNVRNDADTDKAGVVRATFAETLTSAGLVEIDLNL